MMRWASGGTRMPDAGGAAPSPPASSAPAGAALEPVARSEPEGCSPEGAAGASGSPEGGAVVAGGGAVVVVGSGSSGGTWAAAAGTAMQSAAAARAMTAQRWRCCDEWCTLIRSVPSAVSPAPRRAAPHCGMARTRRPLVVYVEDEPAVQRLVEVWLEDAGFDVVVAGDGPAGLAAVRAHRPALVVPDAPLPRKPRGSTLVVLPVPPALPAAPVHQ